MKFKEEKIKNVDPETNYRVDLGIQLVNGLALAHLTPTVHWLLKGGNTTLHYPNIQFLHKWVNDSAHKKLKRNSNSE